MDELDLEHIEVIEKRLKLEYVYAGDMKWLLKKLKETYAQLSEYIKKELA